MIFILHQFIILFFFKCAQGSLSVFSPSELSSKFLNKGNLIVTITKIELFLKKFRLILPILVIFPGIKQ